MKCLVLLAAVPSVLGDTCSVSDAQALGNINQEAMTACMGTSTSVSKLESCLRSSGVTLSSGCVACLSTVATAAQACGNTCASDPSNQACTDCVDSLTNSAMQCFETSSFPTGNPADPSGQSIETGTTTKSSATLFVASCVLFIALIAL